MFVQQLPRRLLEVSAVPATCPNLLALKPDLAKTCAWWPCRRPHTRLPRPGPWQKGVCGARSSQLAALLPVRGSVVPPHPRYVAFGLRLPRRAMGLFISRPPRYVGVCAAAALVCLGGRDCVRGGKAAIGLRLSWCSPLRPCPRARFWGPFLRFSPSSLRAGSPSPVWIGL